MSIYPFELISLDKIDSNDKTHLFAFPPKPSKDKLEAMFIEWDNEFYYRGILLEQIGNKESYRPIAENHSILFLEEMGKRSAKCFILRGDSLGVFIQGIIETRIYRELNLIEKACILEKLISEFMVKSPKDYLYLLGEENSDKRIKDIMSLNKLIFDLKEYIVSKKVTLSLALSLSYFSKTEQEIIYFIIKLVKIKTNKLKHLLENIFAIEKKKNGSKKDLLYNIKDLISKKQSDKQSNSINLENDIFTYLFSLRYPIYKEQIDLINKTIASFNLPPKWKIIIPKHLEGEGIKLVFDIKDQEEYRLAASKLNSIMTTKKIDNLFKLL